jgi:dienelactone hydrolase
MRSLIVMALCAIAGAGAHAQDARPAANTAQAAKRELWLADEGRYVRQWLSLGPLTSTQADELAPLRAASPLTDPVPGAEQRFASGSVSTWGVRRTGGDLLDPFGAGMSGGDTALLLAKVARATEGDSQLRIGGNVRGVWVNGAWVAGGGRNTPAFVLDGRIVTTRLEAGINRILLRVERIDRPVPVALRVVDAGFIDDLSAHIAPYIPDDSTGRLRVEFGADQRAAHQIFVEVLAAGGRVVATRDLLPGEVATFEPDETARWAPGPHEVRVRHSTLRGDEVTSYLPWFQGDPAPAVARVLAAADSPGADGHVKMLAEMLRDRAGRGWRDLHSPLLEYAELELERAGEPGGNRAGGFVRLAWTDEIDGSTQFCRAYLPSRYGSQTLTPALVYLHGYNGQNPPYVRWPSIALRHNPVADRHGLVVLEPMARGNVDYRWMGERDVLRCLSAAHRRLRIDAERIYVTGESMGGNGAWLLATRHPHLFAAAAPVFGGWDYRIVRNGYAYANPEATRPMELFVREMHASFAGAEGLLHVPMYIVHGDEDAAVPVDQSRHAAGLLQRWGYDVRYREVPGRGHEDLGARDEIAAWLATHQRVRDPLEVRLRSWDLAGATAHWLSVQAAISPLAMIEARAVLVTENTVRLDTRNVARARIALPHRLLEHPSRPLQVIWNGARHSIERRDGVHTLVAADFEARALDKNPLREGRLSNFFDTPFAIVIGTSSPDPAMKAGLAAKAAALADLWERWQHVRPRVFLDTEISAETAAMHSLLLLGGRDANRLSARLAAQVPLEVGARSIRVDGQRFPVTDAVAQMIYPHPSHAERYLLLVAPTSAAGLRFWNPQQYWHALNGFPLNLWDWTIVDGRRVTQASGLFPDRGWVAAGLFDTHWRRAGRFTVSGDAEARARAPLRRAPPPGFKLPAQSLREFAGRYRIEDGQIGGGGLINVRVEGDVITASAPEGGRAWPLEAETASHFAIVGLGTPVSFSRDDAGRVAGLVYQYNGQEIVATRQAE